MKWFLAVMLTLAASVASAEPWLCTEPDGSRRFSYEPESAARKNCVHHPVPSGNVWRARPRTADFEQQSASFPRVDAKTQKQRDATRRAILERELLEERRSLAAAMTLLADQKRELGGKDRNDARLEERLKLYQDRVRVHLTNISNLEKELANEG